MKTTEEKHWPSFIDFRVFLHGTKCNILAIRRRKLLDNVDNIGVFNSIRCKK